MRRVRVAVGAWAVAGSAALGLAACDSDDPAGPGEQIAESIRTDAHIMAAMHESNLGEIEAGEVALQKASEPDVETFAQLMIQHHTVLDQQGTALAAPLGITPALPDQRLPEQQALEMQLLAQTAAGASFDRVYIEQQITAHERTLRLVDASLERAQRAEVRTLLQQARPAIVQHLELAQSIQGDVGRP